MYYIGTAEIARKRKSIHLVLNFKIVFIYKHFEIIVILELTFTLYKKVKFYRFFY